MLRTFKILVVCAGIVTIWGAPGSAFQLFGSGTGFHSDGNNPLQQSAEEKPSLDETPLDLGENGQSVPSQSEGMNIWIPGLGVVGKMPKFDFGLEMLYGVDEPSRDEFGGAGDLKEFESDFSIKGTIKRKF
ncbi:MAG: hypothetical protein L3J67_10265 [Hyphomicrobiaceae bacterium]|nr:hypothetical protein [Hyphomicrobiaceae bacterium]